MDPSPVPSEGIGLTQRLLGRLAFRLLRRSFVLAGSCARGRVADFAASVPVNLASYLARAPVDSTWLACWSVRAALSGRVWGTCDDPWGRWVGQLCWLLRAALV